MQKETEIPRFLSACDGREVDGNQTCENLGAPYDYSVERMALAPWLGSDCNLVKLDRWKQKGFYEHVDERKLLAKPAEIDEKMAVAVLQLAIRIVDAVNFVMKRQHWAVQGPNYRTATKTYG